VNILSKHTEALHFKITDKKLIKKFFYLKQKIGEEMKRNGKSRSKYITNIDCLREMIKKIHSFYKSDKVKTLEKLRNLKKKVLKKKMELKKLN
jgi:hypothetical protein